MSRIVRTRAAAIVSDGGLKVPENAIRLDFPVALSVGLFVLAIAVFGSRAGRRDGIFMLSFYALYLAVLISISFYDDLLGIFSIIAIGLVLPAALLTSALAIYLERRRGPARLEVPFVDR